MPRLGSAVLFSLLIASQSLAAGRELAPRGSAPTSYQTSDPHVAFAGERFLTVWTEDMSRIGTHLMGAFSDASGRRLTAISFPVSRSFRGRTLQLVGTGDSYALFWKDAFDKTHLSDIDLNGHITRTTTLALPQHIGLRVAWNGTRFFAALRHPVGVTYSAEGVLLARSGEIVRYDLPVDDNAYAFHVIADGYGFAAATSGFDGVFAYRISADGDVTSYAVDEMQSDIAFVSTTVQGGLLVAWATLTEVRAAVVDSSGELQPHQVLVTSTQPRRVLHVRRVNDAHLISYLALVGNTHSGIATIMRHADGTLTQPGEVVGQFSASVLTPVVAASSAQTTLAVFTQPTIWPAPLMSVAIANDATSSEPEFVSVSRARHSQPILGSNGASLLAAWSDIQGTAAFVRTTSLASDGATLNDSIAAPAYVATRELPWNGSEYLVVESRNDQLLATRVAHDGTPLDAQPFLLGHHAQPWWALNAAVTWVGDRWMVGWESYDGIHLAIVHNGVTASSRKLSLGEVYASDPALSFNGTTLLLVWNETTNAPCWFPPCDQSTRTVAGRLTRDGDLVDTTPLEIPTASSAYSIATSGNEFLVLGETTATTIDASAAPRIIASRRIFNWQASGDVAWDGASYAVALRYFGVRWHLSVTHFDRELNVLGAPRGTETLPPDLFTAPSIAGSVVAVQEGDAAEGARAVVYLEADMQPLPAPPPAPRNALARPTGDGKFEITWYASATAELYRVEARTEYGLVFIADVAADQPLRVIAPYAIVRVTAFNAGGASEPLPRRRAARP